MILNFKNKLKRTRDFHFSLFKTYLENNAYFYKYTSVYLIKKYSIK